MLAWETARQWWLDHSSTESFEERLGWHLSSGLVYSTPGVFFMASEVTWDPASREIIQSPIPNPPLPNAWYVDLAVLHESPISLLMQVVPRPHEWVLFRRDNGFTIHAYRWSRFAQKVGLAK
jgi:hypothetical protein